MLIVAQRHFAPSSAISTAPLPSDSSPRTRFCSLPPHPPPRPSQHSYPRPKGRSERPESSSSQHNRQKKLPPPVQPNEELDENDPTLGYFVVSDDYVSEMSDDEVGVMPQLPIEPKAELEDVIEVLDDDEDEQQEEDQEAEENEMGEVDEVEGTQRRRSYPSWMADAERVRYSEGSEEDIPSRSPSPILSAASAPTRSSSSVRSAHRTGTSSSSIPRRRRSSSSNKRHPRSAATPSVREYFAASAPIPCPSSSISSQRTLTQSRPRPLSSSSGSRTQRSHASFSHPRPRLRGSGRNIQQIFYNEDGSLRVLPPRREPPQSAGESQDSLLLECSPLEPTPQPQPPPRPPAAARYSSSASVHLTSFPLPVTDIREFSSSSVPLPALYPPLPQAIYFSQPTRTNIFGRNFDNKEVCHICSPSCPSLLIFPIHSSKNCQHKFFES